MSDSKRVEFPCNVGAGRGAARSLTEFLAGKGFDEETLFACELALTEACNNAVQHYRAPAGHDTPAATPLIAAETVVNGSTIELRVTDHTPGFDHPGKLAAPMPEITSGRGLYLIQSMMDEVRYERGSSGNVLVMTKRVSMK
jgi:anti-sigma regulatory factor (Ser/Thr protein kinase)